jgi:hypothetical protein
MFFQQIITHLFLAFGTTDLQRLLVMEFRPSFIDSGVIIMIAGMIVWRALLGKWDRRMVDNPVFILAAVSLILTLVSRRIFSDWGIPALAVWMACEFDEFFSANLDRPHRRIALLIIACVVLYLSITSDAGSRWTQFKPIDYISAGDAGQKPWLPESGGIIYSDDMTVFYSTFFKNPTASWRYILGFEPALMPAGDLVILRDIQRNNRLYSYYYPWVKKMTSKDRLIIRGSPGNKPKIPELEWHYVAHWTWSGRLQN